MPLSRAASSSSAPDNGGANDDTYSERMSNTECEVLPIQPSPEEKDSNQETHPSAFTCLQAKFGPLVSVTATTQVALVVLKDNMACRTSSGDKSMVRRVARETGLPVAVLATRGRCFFHEKALTAQQLGAVATIVSNTQRRPAEVMTAPIQVCLGLGVARAHTPCASWLVEFAITRIPPFL